MIPNQSRFRGASVAACLGVALLALSTPVRASGFVVTNLVSNQQGVAATTDPNLVNAWGLAASGSSPWWVANNGTGLSTLYGSTGPSNVSVNSLVVAMPGNNPGTGFATPITGMVFNGGSSFNADRFIFASEDGTINGWRSTLGTTAELGATTVGGSYKGLAIGTNAVGDHLYGTDFAHGTVNAFNSTYGAISLAGSFTDPNLPAGYSPFGIRNIGNQLFVTYAVRNPATGDDVAGPGNGLVDVFDLDGNFQRRLTTGGNLNSPWGLAMAPAGFGTFGGDLLVGNFGDGKINVYNPTTGAFVGTLTDSSNNPIAIDGLWGIDFGNGGSAGPTGVLYFTSGPNDEANGLFGSIATPEPATLALLVGGLALLRRRL